MADSPAPNQVLDAIMEQAQVFASAWSLVGSAFDRGDEMDNAKTMKACLRVMIGAALANETSDERIYTKADAESLCAIAVAGVQHRAAQPPYHLRAFWSPDNKHLVTVHLFDGKIIALQDDNGDEWKPEGEQQDVRTMGLPSPAEVVLQDAEARRAPTTGDGR